MGKGYNNYMCKKPFHPGSKANIKRTWMAEQRTENEKKKQEELKNQYEKEQDLYNNRALISTESKDKLQLNFMYEAPPGAKRERQKEDDEPEYKFEWQRKYNAPREDFAKGNAEIRDQPFGIPVRNVRCIKCHKWGHINTDKECPLFSQASTSSMPTTSMDPLELMRQMREDGYNLKQNVLGHRLNPQAANQQLLESEEEDPEKVFLESLTAKQKHKLLKKLNKLAKKGKIDSSCSKKKSKKKHKSKKKSSECESEEDEKERRKAKKMAKRAAASTDTGPNESSDSERNGSQKIKKSVNQDNKNSQGSASSNSEDGKVGEGKDRRMSATSSSKDRHSDTKSKDAKEKHKYSSTSEIVGMKHGTKGKAKNDSKDSCSESSNPDKLSDSKDRIKTHIKQEAKGTSSKHKSKRRSSDSSSESRSSGSESSPDSNKHVKEEAKVSSSEPKTKSSSSSSDSSHDRIKHVKQEAKDLPSGTKTKSNSSSSGRSSSSESSPDRIKHSNQESQDSSSERKRKRKSSHSSGESSPDKIKHAKKEAEDSSSKHQKKSSLLKCEGQSSDSESDPEEHQPKWLKSEPKKDTFSTVKIETPDAPKQNIDPVGSEQSSPESSVSVMTKDSSRERSRSPLEHPDKITCQTLPHPSKLETGHKSKLATFLLERKYDGGKDEKFRKINRDRRSPSFKQKYRLM